jgi:hypothetical protein
VPSLQQRLMKNRVYSMVAAALLSLMVSAQAEVTLFFDNMENGTNGWTTTWYGTWRQDQAWSASTNTSWHFDVTPESAEVGNTWGSLTSPSIAITGVTNATLEFSQLMVSDGEWPHDDDSGSVGISTDGGTTFDWVYWSAMEGNSTETIDLTPYVGQTIVIRFEISVYPYCLECEDQLTESSYATAWHLDDVRVSGN